MKVMLLVPKYITGTELTVPRTMTLLGAVIKKEGYDVTIFDENVMGKFPEKMRKYKPDVICVSCTTANIDRGIELAKITKRHDKKIKIIFGGIHSTVMYKNLVKEKNIDIVVRGEAEKTIIDLLNVIKKGNIGKVEGISYMRGNKTFHNSPSKLIEDLNKLPLPDYDMIDASKYERAYIITSRGCPGRCTFCGSHTIFGYKTRYRSPENVVDEVEILKNKGFSYIWFTDDTFTLDKERVHKICDEMIRRNLKMTWICMSRVNTVDKKLLKKMKKAGCRRVNFGIESGDEKVIKRIKKGIRIVDVINAFKMCKEVGIETTAYIMVGLPGETWDSIFKTRDLIRVIKPSITMITVLVPYPDTDIYRELREKNVIKSDEQNWKDFKLYTDNEVASPYILFLNESLSNLNKEEIVKAYDLLLKTGQRITYMNKLKSPRFIFRKIIEIRSYSEVKRYLSIGKNLMKQMYSSR